MDFSERLPLLLLTAWLLPLAAFALVVLFGKRMGKAGIGGAYLATGAITVSFGLSLIGLFGWLNTHGLPTITHHDDHYHAADHEGEVAGVETPDVPLALLDRAYYGDWYTLAEFGSLKLSIGYYIDSLTVLMFCMVTLIATCIHFYAMGYMHEE